MPSQPFIVPQTAFDRRKLGKFEVLCRLTAGGMSEIYLAHSTGLAGFKKLVVLKTILPDISGEEDFVRMFLDEARTTAQFQHPNIAQVYELDTDEGQLFMAMEFVQGCTLVEMARACRQAKEPIPLGFSLGSVRDTALALHYAHTFTDARGRRNVVIHRDVAEKNIMVTYEGVTKLLDFGIAKALGRSNRTSVGMVKGTSGYMSPEQIRGEPLDARSDVFSLGVVLHECLTGLRLFHGKKPEEGMLAALHTTVAPPSKQNKAVTPDIDAVVLKALSRDREARFSTALEFARAIDRAAPGLIWHPEQSGELVQRHFAERRAETRRMLEGASFGSEATGEIRIASVMAKVKSSAMNSQSGERGPSSSQPVSMSSLLTTEPGAGARGRSEAVTTPARSPVTQPQPPSTPPIPPPRPLTSKDSITELPLVAPRPPPARSFRDDDDDDNEAKTIPAGELPEELRSLRDRARAKKAEATRFDRAPSQPPRSETGETLSVTGRSVAPKWTDDDDDEVGARTTVAAPEEAGRARSSHQDLRSTNELARGTSTQATLQPRRLGLWFLLAALVGALGVGLLVLFEVGPFAHEAPHTTPRK